MEPTELDLGRLEELAAKATPGPWEFRPGNDREGDSCDLLMGAIGDPCEDAEWVQVLFDEPALGLEQYQANWELVVEVRNALPAILAKLREGERAEELNAASHDMLMKANARLTAERDALARALVSLDGSLTAAATPKEYYDGNGYAFRLRRDLREYHADALAIARRVAG